MNLISSGRLNQKLFTLIELHRKNMRRFETLNRSNIGQLAIHMAYALGLLIILASWASTQSLEPPVEGRPVISLGREVHFVSRPNYGLTRAGDTDEFDLTDGKISQRCAQGGNCALWFDQNAVGWSYMGLVNFALDLGKVKPVDEVAIRFQGGASQAFINFPSTIEVMASDNGKDFYRVGNFYSGERDDLRRFKVPETKGKNWVHAIRFQNLGIRARWIGFRVYVSGLLVSDELYVFGPPPNADESDYREVSTVGKPSDYSITLPQPYFHKPELFLMTDVVGPVPIGIEVPETSRNSRFVLRLEVPEDIEFLGGRLGEIDLNPERGILLEDGYTRLDFQLQAIGSNRGWGRIYMRAPGVTDGETSDMRYQFIYDNDHTSPIMHMPVTGVELPPTRMPERILTTIPWWSTADSLRWPEVMESYRRIGLNAFRSHSRNPEEKAFADEVRDAGFYIVLVDSPLHRMPREPEIFHQIEGKQSNQFCPAYRGQYYQEELRRISNNFGIIRPHFASFDIEMWNWRGPTESPDCSRCISDFEDSGLKDWDEWKLVKGEEMWRDMKSAARRGAAQAEGPQFRLGVYDWRPGHNYSQVWSFDRFYEKGLIDDAQKDTYSNLYPYHIELIGDQARKASESLSSSNQMPWLTPGDAGPFPAEAFQWAILEALCNGSRGLYFWSERVWDTEDLIGFNTAIRGITGVEDIIVDGSLVGERAVVMGPGRLSGMYLDAEMVLLAADYFGKSNGSVVIRIDVYRPSHLQDLLTGEVLSERLRAGVHTVRIDLKGERARLLHLKAE